MLAPIDLLVVLKLCTKGDSSWGQVQLASELFISQSSVHAALRSAESVRLFDPRRRRINALALEEALVHGAKYFLGPKRGGVTRGMPTSWAAPPLVDQIATSDELVPIWPDPEGPVRGVAFEPLYKTVPKAAKQDPALYELLAIVDVLREGRARETKLATNALKERIRQR